MELRTITEEAAWERAVKRLPMHHILQSWVWGDFKARWGWRPTRLLWLEDGEPIAAAQLLRRPLPYTPLGIGYVSKGPLLAADNGPRLRRVLADLEAEGRRQRCLFVKIDPDVSRAAENVTTLLTARGWQPGEPIQFANTGVLDLRPDEESLLAAMKSKTRYNIRLAERRGVDVRVGAPEHFDRFYEMYAETAQRDGFLIRPRRYYLDLWETLHTRGMAHLLLAWVEGQAVAGVMLFRFGDRVWYFYGASTELHRNLMPNYALQWAAIRWSKEVGALEYDLWGAPDDLADPDDGMAGVWRFKEGFDVRFRAQIGAWDYPVSTLGYRLYTEGIPRVLALLRRRSPAA